MGSNFFYLAFGLGSLAFTAAAVSIQELPQKNNENDAATSSAAAILKSLVPPSLLLPTEIFNPSQSDVHPAHLLPLDMMPLQVTPLDSKLEEMSEQSKLHSDEIARLIESTLMEYFNYSTSDIGPGSGGSSNVNKGSKVGNNSSKHLWSKFDTRQENFELPSVVENESIKEEDDELLTAVIMAESEDDSAAAVSAATAGGVEDITLELNPNSSDLEFVHTNSTHKPVSPVPNFTAQILTLSYGGVSKPVLIVQPEMSKNTLKAAAHHKNSEVDDSTTQNLNETSQQEQQQQNAGPMEETSIPSFSIHFPLDTNSQFQIPRYNFTLPTLFLPGLVFTQNENVKTNTHEVHVSFPHSNDLTRPIPPPLAQAGFELLPFSTHKGPGGQDDVTINFQGKPVESEAIKPNGENPEIAAAAAATIVAIDDRKNVSIIENNKEKPQPRPGDKVLATLSVTPIANMSKPQSLPPPAKQNVSKPLNVTTGTNSVKDKWKFPSLGQLYSKFIGGFGRREDEEGEIVREYQQSPSPLSSSSDDGATGPVYEEDEKSLNKLCAPQDELCGATCHRLGFYQGKCVDDLSCVCLLKQKPDLGVKLDYYADKRDRSWQQVYPVHGLCHVSSCRINCGRAGYVTGFCDTTCLCGQPWAAEERTVVEK